MWAYPAGRGDVGTGVSRELGQCGSWAGISHFIAGHLSLLACRPLGPLPPQGKKASCESGTCPLIRSRPQTGEDPSALPWGAASCPGQDAGPDGVWTEEPGSALALDLRPVTHLSESRCPRS